MAGTTTLWWRAYGDSDLVRAAGTRPILRVSFSPQASISVIDVQILTENDPIVRSTTSQPQRDAFLKLAQQSVCWVLRQSSSALPSAIETWIRAKDQPLYEMLGFRYTDVMKESLPPWLGMRADTAWLLQACAKTPDVQPQTH
jgi:hypothetical protein